MLPQMFCGSRASPTGQLSGAATVMTSYNRRSSSAVRFSASQFLRILRPMCFLCSVVCVGCLLPIDDFTAPIALANHQRAHAFSGFAGVPTLVSPSSWSCTMLDMRLLRCHADSMQCVFAALAPLPRLNRQQGHHPTFSARSGEIGGTRRLFRRLTIYNSTNT